METSQLNEMTNIEIYRKDTKRLLSIKIELDNPSITKKPDVINYLINHYYESKNSKQN